MQVREAAQQDLGLRADAAADLQQPTRAGVVDVVEDRGFCDTGLPDQPRLLDFGEAVEIGEFGSVVIVVIRFDPVRVPLLRSPPGEGATR